MRARMIGVVVAATSVLTVGSTAVAQTGAPPDGVIATGVSVDGVQIGGMTVDQARDTLVTRLVRPRLEPIRLVLKRRAMTLKPAGLGLVIPINLTLTDALAYGRTVPLSGTVDLPLRQSVNRSRLARTLRLRAGLVRKAPRNVILTWRGTAPRVWPAKVGYAVNVPKAVPVVAAALLNRPAKIVLPARLLRPAKTRVGVVLVVSRAARQMTMYNGEKRVRSFSVAVGTPTYPTPSGVFSVIQKQVNPTWFPPSSPWAAGLGTIPPGPGNPLGTRWIGTSAPGIGIHGTYADSSVGTAASHGCLRMHIPEVEWLYNYVKIGTVVRIV